VSSKRSNRSGGEGTDKSGDESTSASASASAGEGDSEGSTLHPPRQAERESTDLNWMRQYQKQPSLGDSRYVSASSHHSNRESRETFDDIMRASQVEDTSPPPPASQVSCID
jgi:hypothetical protein